MLATTDFKLKTGYTMRSATMADVETAVTLFNIRSRHDTGNDGATVAEIAHEWDTPNFDPARDIRLVFAADNTLVGYIELWATANPPVHPWVWGCVHPDHERQGIGTALMTWAIDHAHNVMDRVPEGARVSVMVDTLTQNEGAKHLFTNLGMTNVRHFWRMAIDLTDDLPAPVWPQNIRVVTGDVYGDALVPDAYRTVNEAFADHWGHVDRDVEEGVARWVHRSESDPNFDPSLWFIALDGDEIAGASLCRHHVDDDPKMGWVDTLGVRRPWRRQGLAMALLRHSFHVLRERGQSKVGLGVDATSLTNATKLYTKAGMHVARQYDAYELELRAGEELANRG